MKKLLLSFLFISVVYSQNNYTNIEGWDKAKWGMSKAEIFEIYKEEKIIEDRLNHLKIKDYEIGKLDFDIEFEFEHDSLSTVILRYEETNPLLGIDRYNDLESKLLIKYGEFIHKAENKSSRGNAVPENIITKWVLEKTTIQLSYVDLRIINKASITIIYSPNIIEPEL